jgi:dTDP-4-dehydrorhamnose 3,5-epimerase
MKFTPLDIPDVILVEPKVFGDERGFFMETWRQELFAQNGISEPFVQDNHSMSSQGILRGLHYQIKKPQGKLARVIRGEVFDVAVDIRRNSPTFGKWVGEILSAENKRMLWVPPGFAHGFYVISDIAEFVYKCTEYYAPEHEKSIIWNDPDIAIAWPLINETPPLLSGKDNAAVSFGEAETYP